MNLFNEVKLGETMISQGVTKLFRIVQIGTEPTFHVQQLIPTGPTTGSWRDLSSHTAATHGEALAAAINGMHADQMKYAQAVQQRQQQNNQIAGIIRAS